MKITTITYQRVLNLYDYNSKRLEHSAEVLEGEDPEEETSKLMQFVERKIREDVSTKVEEEIKERTRKLRELIKECEQVKSSLESLKPEKEPDSDDIPFNRGEIPKDSSISPDDTSKYF